MGRNSPKPMAGFSLVELMISVVIVSIISVALSLALFRTKEKTHSYSVNLTSSQDYQTVLRQIAQDCRQATQIRRVMDGKYLITITTSPLQSVTYTLKPDHSLTMMFNNIPDCKMLLTQVTQLFFEAETTTRNGTIYLRGITIVLTIGSDNESETYTHTLSLLNQPLWKDDMASEG